MDTTMNFFSLEGDDITWDITRNHDESFNVTTKEDSDGNKVTFKNYKLIDPYTFKSDMSESQKASMYLRLSICN